MERYSNQDVERWEAANADLLPLLLHRLRYEPNHKAIPHGRGYSMLREDAWARALICAARCQWARVLGWLCVSADATCRLFEAFQNGGDIKPQLLAAGNWQALLHAHASTDAALVIRFCRLFDLDFAGRPEIGSTKDSMFIGRLLKDLTEQRMDDAKCLLAKPRPAAERMFQGYVECLEAITDEDESGFALAVGAASKAWEKYARRSWKGLPDAVCFLNGVGLIRLAEHAWKRRVNCGDPNIPPELLSDLKPEPIELPI